jgi:hypothetical protein
MEIQIDSHTRTCDDNHSSRGADTKNQKYRDCFSYVGIQAGTEEEHSNSITEIHMLVQHNLVGQTLLVLRL